LTRLGKTLADKKRAKVRKRIGQGLNNHDPRLNKIIIQGQKNICHVLNAPGMDTYVPMWQPHGASLVRNSVETCCKTLPFVGGCGATRHIIFR
jgi:hypothetical protein